MMDKFNKSDFWIVLLVASNTFLIVLLLNSVSQRGYQSGLLHVYESNVVCVNAVEDDNG